MSEPILSTVAGVVTRLCISPHDDDNVLFSAVTCMRDRPLVVVCLDSHIQTNRGEVGCSAEERATETMEACKLLGCAVHRLAIRDDAALSYIQDALRVHLNSFRARTVYAPAIQGGNLHHDLVGRVAQEVFGDRVVQYTTYTKTELYTEGTLEIVPTSEELALKNRALDCFASQMRINKPHFDAVRGKSEWLIA